MSDVDSRIEELKKAFGSMNDDELLAYVRQIRADRKVSKRIQRTSAKKTRAKSQTALRKILGGLTKEQIKEMLENG